MSISKTALNLIIGRLVAADQIDLAAPVARYLPWIDPGYAEATVQQVLTMEVANAYDADNADAMVLHHEAATGRSPATPRPGRGDDLPLPGPIGLGPRAPATR
jgi:CubicO group peptidase (beta-lactamase class C family)